MPTLAVLRGRVQIKLRDMESKQPLLDVFSIDHAIADAAIALQAQIPAPRVQLTGALTIAAGDTFTMPTAAQTGYVSLTQYAGDVRIRLQSTRQFLERRTVKEIDLLRNGISAVAPSAHPSDFCLWEEMDNDLQGRCWPPAASAEVCDLFVSIMPDDLRDAADLEAANVRFSRYGATALVFHAAALIAASLSPAELADRKLNASVATAWEREAQVLLYQEEARRGRNESVGRIVRYVP